MSVELDEGRCKACRGWCCLRFWLPVPLDEDDNVLWDLAVTGGALEEKDAAIIKEHFVRIRDYEMETPSYTAARHANTFKDKCHRFVDTLFTCSAYDLDAGTCTRYDDRPYMCRQYECLGMNCNWHNFSNQRKALQEMGRWNEFKNELPESAEYDETEKEDL